MFDNAHCNWLLKSIREAATNPYDKWEGAIDPRYAMALGLIAGICCEALNAVEENRPMKLGISKEHR